MPIKAIGAPQKLTIEIQDAVVQSIRAGNYLKVACAAAGIGVSTLNQWRRDERKQFAAFAAAVDEAIAYAEQRNVALIQRAAVTTWQAAAWYLERKHRDRWGKEQPRNSGVIHGELADGTAVTLELPEGRDNADIIGAIASRLNNGEQTVTVDVEPAEDTGRTMGDNLPTDWNEDSEDESLSESRFTLWSSR